jgi:DsbC/DsbD-like thiol-disulfide interchange protein
MSLLRTLYSTLVAFGVLLAAGTANASDEASLRTEQMTVRLASEPPGPDGRVRGALLLDLAPGWKTYWIDPGESGIPPTIDFSGTSGYGRAELHFPAPRRFGEGLARANGYDQSLAVGFELVPEVDARLGSVEASILLGVCRHICIPVQGTLTATRADDGIVRAAFAALPATGTAAGAMMSAGLFADMLTVTVAGAGKDGSAGPRSDADLFVSGPEGWYFGEPEAPARQDDQLVFSVPVLERPRGETGPPERIDVVFTDGADAVEARGLAVTASP